MFYNYRIIRKIPKLRTCVAKLGERNSRPQIVNIRDAYVGYICITLHDDGVTDYLIALSGLLLLFGLYCLTLAWRKLCETLSLDSS